MKRCFLLLVILILAPSIAAPAFAMDVMVGAKAGYYIWSPFYKDGVGASGMNDIDYGAGVLAGPIFSLLITSDLTFSLAGLAGRQSTHWQTKFKEYDFESGNKNISGGYYFDALRIDIDTALSYRISDIVKVFAGYKLLYLKTDYKYTELRSDLGTNDLEEVDMMDTTFVTPLHGPALGIGVSLPLSERVFVSANISGLYMIGTFDDTKNKVYSYNPENFQLPPLDTNEPDFKKTSMEQFGLNVEPAIGFNPGNGLPLISLGFRFQWMRVHFTEKNQELPDDWFDDYLYGVFVSAVYVF